MIPILAIAIGIAALLAIFLYVAVAKCEESGEQQPHWWCPLCLLCRAFARRMP
jgi:hypothetical protein